MKRRRLCMSAFSNSCPLNSLLFNRTVLHPDYELNDLVLGQAVFKFITELQHLQDEHVFVNSTNAVIL
jgi:hypothetical protein